MSKKLFKLNLCDSDPLNISQWPTLKQPFLHHVNEGCFKINLLLLNHFANPHWRIMERLHCNHVGEGLSRLDLVSHWYCHSANITPTRVIMHRKKIHMNISVKLSVFIQITRNWNYTSKVSFKTSSIHTRFSHHMCVRFGNHHTHTHSGVPLLSFKIVEWRIVQQIYWAPQRSDFVDFKNIHSLLGCTMEYNMHMYS